MFNDFLVLGQIPGTNIMITFNELLTLFGLAAAGLAGYKLFPRRRPILIVKQLRSRVITLIEARQPRQLSLPL